MVGTEDGVTLSDTIGVPYNELHNTISCSYIHISNLISLFL